MFFDFRALSAFFLCLCLLSNQVAGQDNPFGDSSPSNAVRNGADPFSNVGELSPKQAEPAPRASWVSRGEIDLEAMLEKKVNFDFKEVVLAEVRKVIQENMGVATYLHESALDDALDDDVLITFRSGGELSMRKALELMLEPYNADFIIDENVIKIISRDLVDEQQFFIRRIFNARPLIKLIADDRMQQYQGDSEPPRRWEITMIAEEELVKLIKETVDPDTWHDTNGDGTIVAINGLLVVNSSRRVVEQVESLIEDLHAELSKSLE